MTDEVLPTAPEQPAVPSRAPRCRQCGAELPAGYEDRKLCGECRAPIRLAPQPVPRGPTGWCADHPQARVTGVCNACGAFTCVLCEISVRGLRYCKRCREQLALRLAAPVAWEERNAIGRISAWWKTTADITARPGAFFDRMDPTGDMSAALQYALIGSSMQWLWQILLMGLYVGMFVVMAIIMVIAGAAAQSGSAGPGLVMLAVAGAFLLCTLATPVFNLVFVIILATVQHGCLRLVGAGGEQGLTATLKVACYSMAPGWTGLIPYFGQMAVPVWWAILMVVGTAKVHRCSVTRSLATLVPFLVMFISPIVAYAALMVVAMVAEAL